MAERVLAKPVLAGAAALMLLLTGVLGHAHASLVPSAIVVGYAGLFVPYALLLAAAWHARLSARAILVLALLLRAILIFADPVLSDDIFRYVWEGRVSLAGFNPFVLAPDAEQLRHLRDDAIWPSLNHPEVPTIYPPVAQYFFALNAALGGGVTLLKALFVAVELAAGAALFKILEARWSTLQLVRALALYALNPLVFVEVAWSGHVDVLAWAPLVVFFALWRDQASPRVLIVGALLFGVSIAAKFLGLLVAPFLLLRRPRGAWRPALLRRFLMLAIAAAIVVVSYVPYRDAGPKLFGGFSTYASHWRSNDGMFRLFEATTRRALDAQRPDEEDPIFRFSRYDELALEMGFTKTWQGQILPNTSFSSTQIAIFVAKAIAALILALALLWCVMVLRDAVRAMAVLLLVLFFVAPTVHPWYVAWLVPLCALRFDRASLVFSATVLIGYAAWISSHAGGPWHVAWWLALIEYGLVFVAVLFDLKAAPPANDKPEDEGEPAPDARDQELGRSSSG